MSRLQIIKPDKIQKTMDSLYLDFAHRNAAAPEGNCPVEQTAALVKLSLAQSCGKCVPCRIGLDRMEKLMTKILDGDADMSDLDMLERTARVIMDSADCAIGSEAARSVLLSLNGAKEDYIEHCKNHKCLAEFKPVPCRHACPAHVDIPGYIALVKEGRYADSVRLIRKDNPFPSACALVCEHPCESRCRRSLVDDAINIRGIKRVAVDAAGHVPAPQCNESTGKKVAVIGGGPGGLTAAYFLRLMGHSVTVFEQRNLLGGMLRYGIPRYRLPDKYLNEDIDVILSTGIEVKKNISVGKDIKLSRLREEYDAVYISIGAHSYRNLGIEGQDADNIISAVELLRAIGDGDKPDFTDMNIVVVGGGNVAMDVTRTAKRLGAKTVKCVYRRRQVDMTAQVEEVEGAIAEGCDIVPLMAPVRVEKDENNQAIALVVQPQIPGEYDRGRPKPVNANRPEEKIPCDMIIAAIGQEIDSLPFSEEGVPTKWNNILSDKFCMIEGMDGVFAGGDCRSGPSTAIRAIEAGKTAAGNIDEYLGFHSVLPAPPEIPRASHQARGAMGRINMVERTPSDRIKDFDIMEIGMTEEEAKHECSRCLRCDHYGYGGFRGAREERWTQW